MSGDYEKLVQEWLRYFGPLQQEMEADERVAASSEAVAKLFACIFLPQDAETQQLLKKIQQGQDVHGALDQLLEIGEKRVNHLLAKESLTIREASIVATFKRRKVTTQDWIRRQISHEKLIASKYGRSYAIETKALLSFLRQNPV